MAINRFRRSLNHALENNKNRFDCWLDTRLSKAATDAGYQVTETTPHLQSARSLYNTAEMRIAGFRFYRVTWPEYAPVPKSPESTPPDSPTPKLAFLKGVPGSARTLLRDPGIEEITVTDGARSNAIIYDTLLSNVLFVQWLWTYFQIDLHPEKDSDVLREVRDRLLAEARQRHILAVVTHTETKAGPAIATIAPEQDGTLDRVHAEAGSYRERDFGFFSIVVTAPHLDEPRTLITSSTAGPEAFRSWCHRHLNLDLASSDLMLMNAVDRLVAEAKAEPAQSSDPT